MVTFVEKKASCRRIDNRVPLRKSFERYILSVITYIIKIDKHG